MIRYVGCDYARTRLDAFADGELPMGDQVLVETHLRWCQTCAARLEDAQTIGDSLRLTARAHAHAGNTHMDDTGGMPGELGRALATMQAEVLARANTEYEQSFSARVEELFSDMRLWWPALGATVAVALSVGVASNVWKATSTEQPTSLAAMIESLAEPGSNRNPQRLDAAMYLPRLEDHWFLERMRDQIIILAVGGNDFLLGQNQGLSQLLSSKGIPNVLDVWGGYVHDWPAWKGMMQKHVEW